MRPFIWTQATGILPLASILSEMGMEIGNNDQFDITRFSADGNTILLRGNFYTGEGYPTTSVFAVHLVPKATSN